MLFCKKQRKFMKHDEPYNKEKSLLTERRGYEIWGYRMCMKDRMERFLADVLDIHNKDIIEGITCVSSIRHCPKGRTLYSQGETVDTCCFLVNGVTGAFIYTTGGKQITDDFSFVSGEMITPLTNRHKKALTSVVALSDVDIFMISNMDAETLFRTYPEFHHVLFAWLMQAYHKQWTLKNVRYQMAAKERYLFFLEEYEGLEDVVSDRFLASFLDMSPETLSRQKRCLREEKSD